MIKGLPRPLLWTERASIDEFLEGNSINQVLYDIYIRLQEKGNYLSPLIPPVVLFNEMYYQLTRYYYYDRKIHLNDPQLIDNINKTLGWKYAADLVTMMMYHYLTLGNKKKRIMGMLVTSPLEEKMRSNPYWSDFNKMNLSSLQVNVAKLDPKRPSPVSPSDLGKEHIDWQIVTKEFDESVVKEVLDLWDYYEDRKEVAKMMFEFMHHEASCGYACSVSDYLEDLAEKEYMNVSHSKPHMQQSELELCKKEIEELNSTIDFYRKQDTEWWGRCKKLEGKLKNAEDLEKKREEEISKWQEKSEHSQKTVDELKSKYNEEVDKNKKRVDELNKDLENYKLKVSDLEKRNKALEEQHKEDEARMSAGFDSLVLETIEDGKVVDQQLLNSDSNKALSESQKQNELSRKQIQEMEKQIQALNDKLGKETVPLKSLADGLKTYAKLYGLKEGKELLKSLSYLLKKEHVWIDNIDSLENFFITAENENKQPVYQGDYVLTKNVENEVNGVASGATGINVNKKGE